MRYIGQILTEQNIEKHFEVYSSEKSTLSFFSENVVNTLTKPSFHKVNAVTVIFYISSTILDIISVKM